MCKNCPKNLALSGQFVGLRSTRRKASNRINEYEWIAEQRRRMVNSYIFFKQQKTGICGEQCVAIAG